MIRGVVEARRARINARACDDRMAALAGELVLQGSRQQVACVALASALCAASVT